MERGNWRIVIVTRDDMFTNFVYDVTFEEAIESMRRQIEGNDKVIDHLVVEA